MSDTVESLILDLLEWIGTRERTYRDTLDAWRTSCPKLPVWENANERGLLEMDSVRGQSVVRLTPAGFALLQEGRPRSCEGLRPRREQTPDDGPSHGESAIEL
jgi:hypothetical protein